MSTKTHETVLEAMAAGRESGVTDAVVRAAPSRPAGARGKSWLELYPKVWPKHPGNPQNMDLRYTRHKATISACKRLRKAGDDVGARKVLRVRLDFEQRYPHRRDEPTPKAGAKKGTAVSPMRRQISELEAALAVVRETNAALRALMAAS